MSDKHIISESEKKFNPIWSSLMQPRETIDYVRRKDDRMYYKTLLYFFGLVVVMGNVVDDAYIVDKTFIIRLLLGAPIVGFITLYIQGWVISLFGKLFKGEAFTDELRLCILWSMVPLILYTPFSIMVFVLGAENYVTVLESSTALLLGYYLLTIVEGILLIWCFINLIRMVAEVQKFTKLKALGTLILPTITVVLLTYLFFLIQGHV